MAPGSSLTLAPHYGTLWQTGSFPAPSVSLCQWRIFFTPKKSLRELLRFFFFLDPQAVKLVSVFKEGLRELYSVPREHPDSQPTAFVESQGQTLWPRVRAQTAGPSLDPPSPQSALTVPSFLLLLSQPPSQRPYNYA